MSGKRTVLEYRVHTYDTWYIRMFVFLNIPYASMATPCGVLSAFVSATNYRTLKTLGALYWNNIPKIIITSMPHVVIISYQYMNNTCSHRKYGAFDA